MARAPKTVQFTMPLKTPKGGKMPTYSRVGHYVETPKVGGRRFTPAKESKPVVETPQKTLDAPKPKKSIGRVIRRAIGAPPRKAIEGPKPAAPSGPPKAITASPSAPPKAITAGTPKKGPVLKSGQQTVTGVATGKTTTINRSDAKSVEGFLSGEEAAYLGQRGASSLSAAQQKTAKPVSTGHYATLGIPNTATPQEIQKAYRAMARTTHPDRPGGSTEAFQKVTEAFNALKPNS